MTDIKALIAANSERWNSAKTTRDFSAVASRLVKFKRRYQTITERTGVPWFVVAVIHEREASQNWNTQLGQGDPLDRVSIHVPKGRGPFATWEDGAVDALVNCPPYAARWRDWSPGGTLALLEMYNGLGYAGRGLPSPYVWAGTDQYSKGKYVADGVFDPNVVDQQLGCAGLILAMQKIDPSISFGKSSSKHVVAGAVVTGGTIAAQQAHASGASLQTIAFIAIATIVVAGAVWFILHRKSNG